MGMIIMNGKEYTSSPKDGFPPIIYSDEEREIGVWRDGKPLYQITKNIGALNSDGYWHRIAHNVSDIDKIINVNGMARVQDTDMDFLPIPNYRPASSYGIVLGIDETNISYIDNWIAGELYTYVTFQYTKTTDVPGSGKYTTYGGLAHHYSTTEQVIGTWIDGKPLYEKTFLKTLSATPTGGGYGVALDSTDLPNCIIRSLSGSCGNVSFGTEFSRYNTNWEGYANIWGIGNGSATYNFRWGNTASADAVIIVQYTKTTD